MSSQQTLAFPDFGDEGYRLILIRRVHLPASQKAVLRSIYDHGGHRPISRPDVPGCYASHQTIAMEVGLCAETVGRAVRELKKAGLVDARKIGIRFGSIVEDKRICWSNLRALFEQQQGLGDDSSLWRPEDETDIETNIQTDNESDIETDSESDKTFKPLNQETKKQSSPPSNRSAPFTPKNAPVPPGWEGVREALKKRKVVEAKPLTRRLAATGAPIRMIREMIEQAGEDANGWPLYSMLNQIGGDDVKAWKRARALKLIGEGKARDAPRWQIEILLAESGVTWADAEGGESCGT